MFAKVGRHLAANLAANFSLATACALKTCVRQIEFAAKITNIGGELFPASTHARPSTHCASACPTLGRELRTMLGAAELHTQKAFGSTLRPDSACRSCSALLTRLEAAFLVSCGMSRAKRQQNDRWNRAHVPDAARRWCSELTREDRT
jgi:hypothetical protein